MHLLPHYENRPNRLRTLSQHQMAFAWAVAQLLAYAYAKGYAVTFGDAYRDPRVHGEFGTNKRSSYSAARSVHKVRLAIDLNLFKPNTRGAMVYQTSTEAHRELGEWWEALGEINGLPLVWGGRFDDGNHYSMRWQGAA